MLPASPKIFYGRDEEVAHVTNTITRSKPARITICGPEGVGKTAVALAASHSAEISQMFGIHRYFVECDDAKDAKQLVAAMARCLQVDSTSKKHVIRHLTAIGTEETPVLVVLDALDRAWKPHENRNDVEDFLSLLADLQHLTLIVTIRGGERPRQIKWTRPFLPTLRPLPPSATRATFLDISDVQPDEPGLEELLEITQNNPTTVTYMARLASFEGCSSLVSRWQQEGPELLLDKAERTPPPRAIFTDGLLSDEPEEMLAPTVVAEQDILALLDPDVHASEREPMPTIDSLMNEPAPTIDALYNKLRQSSSPTIGTLYKKLRQSSFDSISRQSSLGSEWGRSSISSGSRRSSLDSLLRQSSLVVTT
ncbi:hypothetical protein B0H19DRAFT_442701 [Mycena capillaripes]|nr:hypothetical protein B0H19DRAFT_442701 [Mycena capillaripes]